MDHSKATLWTKDFIIYSLMSFFLALVYFLLIIVIPVYAIEAFHASQSLAGLAAGIFVIGALVSRLFAGRYMEVIGRKRLLYSGLALFFLATLLYFLIAHLHFLILVRFLHGVFAGMAFTVLQTVVLDLIPKARRGEGISYYSLSIIFATAIGPFLGMLISQQADIRIVFVFCSTLSIFIMVLTFFAFAPELKIKKETTLQEKGLRLTGFIEKEALPISMIIAILGFSYSGVITFLNAYSMEIGLTEAASFFFIVYSASILLSRPFTGRLFDAKGENIVIYPSFILLAIGFIVLSQANHGFTLLMAAALIGLGYGNLQSCTQAVAVNETPPQRVGLATSTFFICMEGGVGLGPFLLGYLVPVIGFRHTYFVLGIIVFTTILIYYVLHGRKKSYKKQLSRVSLKH